MANNEFLFNKSNYILMGVGLVVITIGFLLMSGGNPEGDPHAYSPEIFSHRRITIAPIIILAGLFIEGYAIMKKDKPEESAN